MKKILVVGDVMLDKYDYCINRDNPESSAPCYRVVRTDYRPGGAGNVAANLASLGADSMLISVIGNDPHGKVLKGIINKAGINSVLIEDNLRPTIVKERILSDTDGRYHFRKDIEKSQYIRPDHVDEILKAASNKDIIIVSDYNKGTISRSLMDNLKKTGRTIIVDPKPNHTIFYCEVFMITPNVKEVLAMAKLEDEDKAVEKLKRDLETRVMLTRGEKGISYFGLDKEKRIDFPAEAKEVFDVTGAGDTVVATFTHFYAKGYKIEECVRLANIAAGIAVGHPGCYQVKEEEVMERINGF